MCGKVKAASAFYVDKNKQDGKARYCKICSKIKRANQVPKSKAKTTTKHKTTTSSSNQTMRPAVSRQTLIQALLIHQSYKCGDPAKDKRRKGCGRDYRPLMELLGASFSSWVHIDHIVPRKLDGSNLPFNLQVLCPPCNLKHDR